MKVKMASIAYRCALATLTNPGSGTIKKVLSAASLALLSTTLAHAASHQDADGTGLCRALFKLDYFGVVGACVRARCPSDIASACV
jgi:hypothetical protein